jgi:hypothetical protein
MLLLNAPAELPSVGPLDQYLEGTQGMGFITAFHTLSKEGTGVLADLTSFCYRGCFFVSCHSNLQMSAEACQEGLFTFTIAKRPGINTRMC